MWLSRRPESVCVLCVAVALWWVSRARWCAGRGGAVGNKFRMGVGRPVAGVMNCADNSGTRSAWRR